MLDADEASHPLLDGAPFAEKRRVGDTIAGHFQIPGRSAAEMGEVVADSRHKFESVSGAEKPFPCASGLVQTPLHRAIHLAAVVAYADIGPGTAFWEAKQLRPVKRATRKLNRGQTRAPPSPEAI